jgi:hypothetical protein
VAKKKPVIQRASNPDSVKVNQHRAIFNDRRTNRERDKSSQNRNSIRRSFNGE